jgi:hypothetical protein
VYHNGTMWIFGGKKADYVLNFAGDLVAIQGDPLNDLYSFTVSEGFWANETKEPLPLPRYNHAAVTLGDIMIIFGGCARNGSVLSDLWTFSFGGLKWKLACTDNVVSRFGHILFGNTSLLATGGSLLSNLSGEEVSMLISLDDILGTVPISSPQLNFCLSSSLAPTPNALVTVTVIPVPTSSFSITFLNDSGTATTAHYQKYNLVYLTLLGIIPLLVGLLVVFIIAVTRKKKSLPPKSEVRLTTQNNPLYE